MDYRMFAGRDESPNGPGATVLKADISRQKFEEWRWGQDLAYAYQPWGSARPERIPSFGAATAEELLCDWVPVTVYGPAKAGRVVVGLQGVSGVTTMELPRMSLSLASADMTMLAYTPRLGVECYEVRSAGRHGVFAGNSLEEAWLKFLRLTGRV